MEIKLVAKTLMINTVDIGNLRNNKMSNSTITTYVAPISEDLAMYMAKEAAV